jgi:putative oxidoreductase
MISQLNARSQYVLSTLRIVVGMLFFAHGLVSLFGFPAAPPWGVAEMFTLGWVSGLLELIGGPLIALGLFTRIVAFVLSGHMAFAYFIGHASDSFVPALNGGDAAILFSFVYLYFVFAGPGPWSIDMKAGRS